MRRTLLVAVAALAVAPGAAHADGLPVGNVDVGGEGVVAPGSPDRIVAVRAGDASTLVARVERDGGRVQSSRVLRGKYTVPGVALDGTADGRSADGRKVVLMRPRSGPGVAQRRTRLIVLSVKPLRVTRRITLRGDFSFDALSRDGRRMYLVHYPDPDDLRKYVVRSYDVPRGRLERGAIVDAREPDEDMRGFPVTRATSRDGRWAYTLYDGGGEPFVHALDTEDRKAFCIDLEMLAGFQDPFSLGLGLDEPGGRLQVLDGEEAVAVVNTETMEASTPAVARAPAPPPVARQGDSGPDWWLAGALAVFAGVALAAARGMRRRRRTAA